jgi:thiamine-monophosphate kinase
MTEDDLIARFFAPLAGAGALGLKDDAACVTPPPGCDLVVTVDALVAGVHFFADDPPDSIARKALGVNLSDLAAKAADPLGYVLALALPTGTDETFLSTFASGLGHAGMDHRIALLGGDTVRTPGPLTISVTAFGAVPTGRMVPRTGARPGDLIAVTGTVGDAALGLLLRTRPELFGERAPNATFAAHLRDRYLHPQPRNRLARALRTHARAAMDVSDGLAGDCAKMLRASGVTGILDLGAAPFSPAARAAVAEAALFEAAVTGGDDYEILLTLPPENWDAFRQDADSEGIPVTAIGRVEEGSEPLRLLRRGLPFVPARGSFSHF